mgnify:CR=1 FL=1
MNCIVKVYKREGCRERVQSAKTVDTVKTAFKNPITEGDSHGFLLVSVKGLNRSKILKKQKKRMSDFPFHAG